MEIAIAAQNMDLYSLVASYRRSVDEKKGNDDVTKTVIKNCLTEANKAPKVSSIDKFPAFYEYWREHLLVVRHGEAVFQFLAEFRFMKYRHLPDTHIKKAAKIAFLGEDHD